MNTLVQNVQNNNYDQVKAILEKQKNDNKFQLHWYETNEKFVEQGFKEAIKLKYNDIVQLFIQMGVGANCKLKEGCPMTYIAAKVNNLEALKIMVSHFEDQLWGLEFSFFKPKSLFGDYYYQSVLEIAVKKRYVDTVRYILKNGGGPNRGNSLLVQVAIDGYLDVIDVLVEYGASVKKAILYLFSYDKQRKMQHVLQTLTDYAFGVDFSYRWQLDGFKEYSLSRIKFLGISLKGEPLTRDNTPFEGIEQVLYTIDEIKSLDEEDRREVLLDRIQKEYARISTKEMSESKPLNFVTLSDATRYGFVEIVSERLQAGINPNQNVKRYEHSDYAIPLISMAVQNENWELIQLFVEHPKLDHSFLIEPLRKTTSKEISDYLLGKIDIDQFDNKGKSLLHYAAEVSDMDQIKMLVNRGANVNLVEEYYEKYTPLLRIVSRLRFIHSEEKFYKTLEMVQFLVSQGADPTYITSKVSIFSFSCKEYPEDRLVASILSGGWAINSIGSQGNNLLECAVKFRSRCYYQPLLREEAEIDLQKCSLTERRIIREKSERAVVEILHKNGRTINSTDSDGNTALHFAAIEGCEDSIRFLLKYRANFVQKNNKGETPFDIASTNDTTKALFEKYINKYQFDNK